MQSRYPRPAPRPALQAGAYFESVDTVRVVVYITGVDVVRGAIRSSRWWTLLKSDRDFQGREHCQGGGLLREGSETLAFFSEGANNGSVAVARLPACLPVRLPACLATCIPTWQPRLMKPHPRNGRASRAAGP